MKMLDDQLEKVVQQFLDKELDKRLRSIQIDLLKENFLTRAEFKEEMEKIHARFEAMDRRFEAMDRRFEAADRRFEALQKQIDKRFDAVDKRFEALQKQIDKRFEAVNKRFDELSLNFGSTMEKIGYSYIKDTLKLEGINEFPSLRAHFIDENHEVHVGSTDVEIDLFSAEVPLIGECTLKVTSLDKLEIFVRKINFIEKRYGKTYRRFFFTLNISPPIEAQVKTFCERWEIKLIFAENEPGPTEPT